MAEPAYGHQTPATSQEIFDASIEEQVAAQEKSKNAVRDQDSDLRYVRYDNEDEDTFLPQIRALMSTELSEPYGIFVYRYFLYQWADLCFMALSPTSQTLHGVVISKLEPHPSNNQHHQQQTLPPLADAPPQFLPQDPPYPPQSSATSPPPLRGYIAMLAVGTSHRRRGIAAHLVQQTISAMISRGADEIVLETEDSNAASLRLYESLGFLRSKCLYRYYLNGSTAYRLVLFVRSGAGVKGLGAERGGAGGEGNREEGGGDLRDVRDWSLEGYLS